jgi:hypothetical protein
MKEKESRSFPLSADARRKELVRLLARILAKHWLREQSGIKDSTAIEENETARCNEGQAGPDARR